MDVTFTFAGISEELGRLLEDNDFAGAEEFLTGVLGACRRASAGSAQEAYIHFEFGRLYQQWNKLSSAVNHFNLAIELTAPQGDSPFLAQVVSELNFARKRQKTQRP